MTPLEPALAEFAGLYARGGGLVWTKRVGDLETPVSALMKLDPKQAGAFLLESVQGGAYRGRYSIIGLRPDLVWRVKNGRAETSRGRFDDAGFRPQKKAPLQSLRDLLKRSALDIPSALPPMAAGLFGYLGYDMVRHVEKLPEGA
ncbi:MAG: anthranilate synthase component I, partial [Hyphomonadaceae bacterium]